jgi:hypothetical protein
MIPGTAPAKEDFKTLLLNAWHSRIPRLREPVCPRVFIREDDSSRIEIAFLLSETADGTGALPLRFRYDHGTMEFSREAMVVEFGDWKGIPDIASALAEMDTFIADFECDR